MKSKCCQHLQCPPDLAGFLSIFQVADEAHARAAGHRQLRLGKSQLSPSLFDETSKSLGGEGGFVFHSRSGIIDDSTGVSTCFIPAREYRVVSEMRQCYLFPLGKMLAFGPKRRDYFSLINQVIEQPRLERLQCRLFCLEEVRLGLAPLLALPRVAVIRVFGNGHVFAALP